MLRMTSCATLLVIISSTVLWSQETVQPRKQRVSPKLLREAMALPEYRAQAPGGKPACHLDDLVQLAEKLKKNGDNAGAELLQQFIIAHKELMQKVGVHRTSTDESIEIECRVIEISAADAPEGSVLRNSGLIDASAEKQAELNRLLLAKRAKAVVTPISIETKTHQAIRFMGKADVSLPLQARIAPSDTGSQACSIVLEVLPMPSDTGNLKLQAHFEVHRRSHLSAGENLVTKDSGETLHKVQVTSDLNYGDALIFSERAFNLGDLYFVVITPTRKN